MKRFLFNLTVPAAVFAMLFALPLLAERDAVQSGAADGATPASGLPGVRPAAVESAARAELEAG